MSRTSSRTPSPLPPSLTTPRLLLRAWKVGDRVPFAQLNADPFVMEHFPEPLTPQASDALMDRIQEKWQEQGYGLWALEHQETRELMGFVGLNMPNFEAHFTPAVEIGWRLAQRFWGQGYACEAAQEVLHFGFQVLDLDEIVSFTATCNRRSVALMKRLGMSHDPAEDFDHPALSAGHRLERHVLYRLSRERWQAINHGEPRERGKNSVGRD